MSGSDGSPSRYRNPPIEHRFRKGVSGNPSGRPRKKDNSGRGGQPNIGFEDRIKSVAIEEAYRLVNIRDGDRVERIPLVQAIIRKLGLAAATGNIRAAQSFLNLLIGAEADRRVATNELLKAAVEYKEYCGRVLAARNGMPGPDLVPHPDDVIIDYARGEVRIDGPLTAEQKAAQDWLRAMAADVVRDLMEINERIRAEPNNLDLRRHQRRLTKVVNWLREDNIKKITRDTLRRARDNPKTTETK